MPCAAHRLGQSPSHPQAKVARPPGGQAVATNRVNPGRGEATRGSRLEVAVECPDVRVWSLAWGIRFGTRGRPAHGSLADSCGRSSWASVYGLLYAAVRVNSPVERPPRVYVSYSHESPTHTEAVLALVQHLRQAGVDAWLDLFEVGPAEGWPRWVLRQIRDADIVLCVCTPTYRRRFDGEDSASDDHSVAWEGLLSTQLLTFADARASGRFIAVVLDDGTVDAVPLQLRPFGVYHWPRDQTRVLCRSFGLAPELPGQLGARPVLTVRAQASSGLALDPLRDDSPAIELPPGLAEAYLAGSLIAFVGADVPLSAGLPAAEALPPAVLREALAYGLDPAVAEEVTAALADGDSGEALGLLAHELGRPMFHGIVAALLAADTRAVPPLAAAIAALAPTLRGILTTNLDDLLARALPAGWTCHPRLTAATDGHRHWLAHLRGMLGEDAGAWALSTGDLRVHLQREPLAAELLTAHLLTRTVMFVGANLDDPDVAEVLVRLAALTRGHGRQHYALVDAANLRAMRSQRRRDLLAAGVVVVPCGHVGGPFGGVLGVLAALARVQG